MGVDPNHRPRAPLDATVARRMSSQRREGTAPEIRLRRELHSRGLRYRLHQRVAKDVRTRPDIVFGPVRVAVFMDGCFWHRCPEHGTLPKNNAEWWLEKLNRNVARDQATNDALREHGWLVLRFWEHDDPVVAADAVENAVRQRIRRS